MVNLCIIRCCVFYKCNMKIMSSRVFFMLLIQIVFVNVFMLKSPIIMVGQFVKKFVIMFYGMEMKNFAFICGGL